MATQLKLPSNYEAECNVLGCCLLSKSAASIVISSLTEDSFLDKRNVAVFKAMNELLSRGQPLDPTIVYDELINLKLDTEVGGVEYLLSLSDSVLNLDNLEHYLGIVKEHQTLRTLLLTVGDMQNKYATGDVANIGEFMSQFGTKITEIVNSREVGGFKSSEEVAKQAQIQLAQLSASDSKGLSGLDTGYKKLNLYTHGWQPGELIIVAARPSMGKTALTLNLAYNTAFLTKKPVAFFSLEMDATSIMNRLISSVARVDNDKLQTGYLSASDKVKIATAVETISEVPLWFDDTPGSLLGDIVAKATKLKTIHPDLSMVVIDYLGKINVTKKGKVESREREVAMCTNQLKELARTLKIPVMLVCQINRDAENNDAKRPSMANLRESGSIEADADKVLILYREDYYTAVGQSVAKKKGFNNQQNPQQQQPNQQAAPRKGVEKDNSVMDVIIAKSRNGKVGTIQLLFSKQYSRFDDLSDEFEEIAAQHQRAMGNGGDYE